MLSRSRQRDGHNVNCCSIPSVAASEEGGAQTLLLDDLAGDLTARLESNAGEMVTSLMLQ